MGKRAVLLLDGPAPPLSLLARWLQEAELFVCADAAGRPYEHLPRRPDLVVGDFDTLFSSTCESQMHHLPEGPGTVHRHITEQDSTDAEKALRELIREGVNEVALFGAIGGRLDHSFFNVSLLERYADKLRLCLVDEHAVSLRLPPGSGTEWELPAGSGFSLLPLSGNASGVQLTGARWGVPNQRVCMGGPCTISNVVDRPPLVVTVEHGSLLLIVAIDGQPFAPDAVDEGVIA
ncbi:MAG: thiamine diphosphokinase [bacterium]|nr:thiamine diphosphokinase [bacterium]